MNKAHADVVFLVSTITYVGPALVQHLIATHMQ